MHEFNLIFTVITIIVIMGVLQGSCAYLIWVERKLAAYVQDRIGPNRVGPFGLLQPIADGLKFLLKEDVIPSRVDKVLFLAAPAIAVGTATFAFAVVPFGQTSVPLNPPVVARAADPSAWELFDQSLAAYQKSFQFVIAPGIDIGILFTFADRQPGRVRHHPRRLGFEQQVQLPRRAALQRPDHQLRNPDGHGRARRRAV